MKQCRGCGAELRVAKAEEVIQDGKTYISQDLVCPNKGCALKDEVQETEQVSIE